MCYSIMVEQDLKALHTRLGAMPVRTQFDLYYNQSSANPKQFRPLANHPRIYPGYFAPVVLFKNNARWIIPMRYRIRPFGSENEIPTKFNVFNARLDSLNNRTTWKNIYMRQHGVIVVKNFYEWVVDENKKKKVISFSKNDGEPLLAPVLWDYWSDGDEKNGFFSFAIITNDPPPSVLKEGHDRCPIELEEKNISFWLNPAATNKHEVENILSRPVPDHFTAKAATP